MNRGLVNLKVLRANIKKADFEGKSSFCFVKGNKIIKVYARKEDKGFFIPPDVTKLHDFSKYSADTIVFPDEYIYENRKKAGEILNYINSKAIFEAFKDSDKIDFIIESYERVISDLQTYSDIDMKDLNFVNILYSSLNGLHIIDTTDWEMKNNSYKINLHRLNANLTSVITDYVLMPIEYNTNHNTINPIFYENLNQYGNAGNYLKRNLDLIKNDKYYFLDLIFACMNFYKYYYGKDMKTLEDMKEMTKVLKKGCI